MLGVILVFLSINCAATAFRDGFGDPRIYTFAFTSIKPGSFFNGTHLIGARVELMKEICCRASKRCAAAMVDFERCYNEDNLSEVLNGRWYDVCLEVSDTPRREASYSFSDIHFFGLGNPVVIVRPDSKVTLKKLKNPRNNIKVAFLANKELATSTVMKEFLKTYFTQPENIIPIGLPGSANHNVDEILRLINDPCSGVDVGIVAQHLIEKGDPFKILTDIKLNLGKSTLMVRKDDQDILDWWDFTLKRFVCSPDYAEFCERIDKQFGIHDLNCLEVEQVDCDDCKPETRVKACGCR